MKPVEFMCACNWRRPLKFHD